MSSHDSGVRFYRVLSAQAPELGPCTTQLELTGNRLVLRPDTTSWFEVPLDYAAARALITALAGDAPAIVRCQHPQHGATTVTGQPHGATASLRVQNTPRGALHVLFDETTLPELIMNLKTVPAGSPVDHEYAGAAAKAGKPQIDATRPLFSSLTQ